MLSVFQVGVRRVVLRGSDLLTRRAPAVGSVPALTRQLSRRTGRTERSCTVDPNLEEEFVFVDWTDQEETSLPSSSLPAPPPSAPPQVNLRSLERQLEALRGVTRQEAEPDSLIQFHDVDFPLDESVIAAIKTKKKKKRAGPGEHKVFGTPDVDEPFSDTCCSGCGAILHCTAPAVPGYLPSEKFKVLQQEKRLSAATCQRCFLLTHHYKALNLEVSADQYREVVQRLRPLRALILLIVDLLDVPDSIIPDLPKLVGTNKHIVVLGNKVDLLPGDSPNYLKRIRQQLSRYCEDAGFGPQVTDIHLISAKTGYGVEHLISSLQRSWKYKGDVYLVGGANAGKSTLFNTLLESDYCKSKASDLIHKATISPWPGTTLNLLKFPIINPTPYRMFKRQERLNEASQQTESELTEDELKRLKHFSKQGYLVGRVGRTFRSDVRPREDEIQFDPDSLAHGEDEDGEMKETGTRSSPDEFTFNELKDAHWLFDTPGIMKERDVLSVLTEQEVMSVVPTKALVPRTFVLKPGMSLLVGALARIDFLQGERSCWFSVLVSARVPVHITSLEKVEGIYEKHAGGVLLGVPQGGSERMKTFPALVPQEVKLEGRGYMEASADITLSSAGWVAVTAAEGEQVSLRVHGPEAAGFGVRTPPLLPHVISLKGERIKKSAAYKTVKPAGLIDATLAARGTEKKQKKKKRKKE
ncbi:nitric oxide-associated protein 1-like isoform X1 [Xyrichtys novacula]|uniref:Nitric oxide-associated protein 1-like isoform X1 n=1 Tax=Xyrichtys novacula TaxID=13765 RepID=A0AAV1FE41_XYRNO|nr:nitric oxide-associated protein 1-like isoform X1 [Xyrichtys novacula]